MENSSTFENLEGMRVEGQTAEFFKKSGKWGKFIAIISFISVGLILIAAIGMFTVGSYVSSAGNLPFSPTLLGLFYLLFGFLTLLYSLYLFRYSNSIIHAADSNSNESLQYAAENIFKFFRLLGILIIVTIALYLIAIIFTVGSAM